MKDMTTNELFQSLLQASEDLESISDDFREMSGSFEYACATALNSGARFDPALIEDHDRMAKALIAAGQRYASLAQQLGATLTAPPRREKTSA